VTEERQVDSTAGTDGTTAEAAVSSGGQTAEEIEAFWRNRQSGVDRAHNAEVAAFKAQIEALKAPKTEVVAGESPEAARIRELQIQLDEANAARQAEALKNQYPSAAGVLGDEITRLSPEKLAAFEAFADTGGGRAPMVDPNMAGRNNSAVQGPEAKPLAEKSKDELLADLRKAAPIIQAEAREGIYR